MPHVRFGIAFAAIVILLPVPALAAGPASYLNKPTEWFASDEGKRIAANVLSHQAEAGGWPKNTYTTVAFAGNRKDIKPTFDNRATTDELRFLARAYAATRDATYRAAFDRGLDYVLKAQYANGGWPQSHPPGKNYPRYITFNDDAMVRLMRFLHEVATEDRYGFVEAERRKAASTAFDKGVECILKCQVRIGGKRTAWCAQHDEVDFSPRPARSYELVSLSGFESVGVVRLLMGIEKPSAEVIDAVEGAVAWFEAAKLTGIKVEVRDDPKSPTGKDKVVVADPKAPALWARFYEIGTNKPIFSDRDGVKKGTLAEIGHERRNGYAWYGTWPQKLLADDYPAWKKRLAGRR
ncbi:MAG TPA: pectate lyase [Gemmataceae bacterium]|nr:pectate lyase [Gemmataceae bacterium]